MSDGSSYADIIILALVAGFILLRLRSVLGQKIGNDEPDFLKQAQARPETPDEPIIKLGDKALKFKIKEPEPDTYLQSVKEKDIADVLTAIKAKDAGFMATQFMQGAKMAYEMVFDAYNKDDKATLKMLLSDDIYNDFVSAIEERSKSDRKAETTLVSVVAKDITKASFSGNMARLMVMFSIEQVTVVRDAEGKIVEGDASQVQRVEQDWMFEKDISSKNPNWKIIET
jgi:predicted lipid-binding transport protein (Tim44 family)